MKASATKERGRAGLKPDTYTLLLEKIFEGLTSVHGPSGRGCFDGDLRRLHVGSGRGILLHRSAKFVELAVVLGVFGRNADLNRLGAFKLRSGIKEAALFAAVQLEIALGTFSLGIEASDENGSAIGAASAGDGANHARGARAEVIGSAAGSTLRRLAIGLVFLLLAVLPFGVAVAAVTVLAIHKCLRPSVLTDCNYTMYNLNKPILFAM